MAKVEEDYKGEIPSSTYKTSGVPCTFKDPSGPELTKSVRPDMTISFNTIKSVKESVENYIKVAKSKLKSQKESPVGETHEDVVKTKVDSGTEDALRQTLTEATNKQGSGIDLDDVNITSALQEGAWHKKRWETEYAPKEAPKKKWYSNGEALGMEGRIDPSNIHIQIRSRMDTDPAASLLRIMALPKAPSKDSKQ